MFINQINRSGIVFAQLIGISHIGEHATVDFC
jgi:hypothetical protein